MRQPILDSTNVWSVTNIFYQAGPLTLVQDSGIVIFYKPIQSTIYYFRFVGSGNLSYSPDTEVEKQNILHYCKSVVYNQEFTDAIVFESDQALINDILSSSTPTTFPVHFDPVNNLAKAIYGSPTTYNLSPIIIQDVINTLQNNTLIAVVSNNGKQIASVWNRILDCGTFALNVQTTEGKLAAVSEYQSHGTNSCRIANGALSSERAYIKQHTISCTIDKSAGTILRDSLTVVILSDSLRTILFWLPKALGLDSVTISTGKKINFHRYGNATFLALPRTFFRDDTVGFTFYYQGEIIKRQKNNIYIRTGNAWFPLISTDQRSLYTTTFTHLDNTSVVSIGNRAQIISDTSDLITTIWKSAEPIPPATFLVDNYKEKTTAQTSDTLVLSMYYRVQHNLTSVLTDIQQSYGYYSNLFGKLHNIDTLTIVGTHSSHSTNFPGFTEVTDSRLYMGGWHEAHNIAHQWWGASVKFSDQRDQWLMEGLSEYSRLMYQHFVDNKEYNILKSMRHKQQTLAEDQELARKDSTYVTSLTLGLTQNSSTKNVNNYFWKSVWTIHMLRNLMLELPSLSDSIFITTLHTFHEEYRGKDASLSDFQQVAEKTYGIQLGWFFKQWIEQQGFPSYTYSWKISTNENGSCRVFCLLKHNNIAEHYTMPMIFKVTLADGSFARVRKVISDKDSVVDVGLFSSEPVHITFNDLESVLCNSIEE